MRLKIGKLICELKVSSNLAKVYLSTYKPTKNTLRKHEILKRLCANKDIMITRPGKGSGIVMLGKTFYEGQLIKASNYCWYNSTSYRGTFT